MAESRSKVRSIKSQPLPDVVDQSTPWFVRESSYPRLDRRSGVMAVPLGIDPVSRDTRNIEMLRLKFSPKAMPKLPIGVDPSLYEACEIGRLRSRGYQLGIPQDLKRHDFETLMSRVVDEDWDEHPERAAKLYMESTRAEHAIITNVIRRAVKKGTLSRGTAYGILGGLEAAVRLVRRKNAGPKQAVKAAELLQYMLAPPPVASDTSLKSTGAKPGDESAGIDPAKMETLVKKGTERLKLMHGDPVKVERQVADLEYKHGSKPGIAELPEASWGELSIARPPRPLVFPAAMRSRRWRATDTGSVFRYPHRWAADKSGFAYRGEKEGGCTMLIDVSGSMSLSHDDILTIMTYMPASLIATYSGSGNRGILSIVADKKKRAVESDFRPGGGGNVVDGPALRWLAKQKGPRFWISDGGVTGRNDIGYSSSSLLTECLWICRKARIARIDSMAHVIELFKNSSHSKIRKF